MDKGSIPQVKCDECGEQYYAAYARQILAQIETALKLAPKKEISMEEMLETHPLRNKNSWIYNTGSSS